MARTARLFVVSGPAGVGKGTLVARLRQLRPDLGLTVSATTRSPRPGEKDGVAYHFMTDEEFTAHVQAGDFLEWAQVHDHRYGTLRSEVDRCLQQGHSVVLEIDVQGARNVRRIYPDAVLVFIEPPSWELLVERLRGRGTESEESLRIRLADAKHELELAPSYDVRIVNDNLEQATNELAQAFDKYESYGGTTHNGNH
ncbi:MAG: guanylate kinase [Coriobacteriales bacterium]|nr:guanylate kinase [Coriobacteriales bacterium]